MPAVQQPPLRADTPSKSLPLCYLQPTDPTAQREITNHLLHVPPASNPAAINCLMQTSLRGARQASLYESCASINEQSFATKANPTQCEHVWAPALPEHSAWQTHLRRYPESICKLRAPSGAQPKCTNGTSCNIHLSDKATNIAQLASKKKKLCNLSLGI